MVNKSYFLCWSSLCLLYYRLVTSVLFILFAVWSSGCGPTTDEITLRDKLTITQSASFRAGIYELPGTNDLNQPVLTIQGDDITLDFDGVVLVGAAEGQMPDQFKGLAVMVKNGKHITIKNLRVRGYKVALMAENVDSLQLIDCDLSYNYRPRLLSTREAEDEQDWLSYHNNENDEWLRYGAGIYLKNCQAATVRGARITQGQNGLLLTGCNDGLFYNNTFHFNSGLGIGMYRSSRNRVMHNRLDWNVRGYSHGIYQRGQDSAGILCYEQSNDNVFAYNSATHSGDGFFLWAGQQTMDTGEGGCNGNLIYKNDFSYAPTNGVEVTFSSNRIIANRMEECRYGVWGGYSWKTLILGNEIANCDYGVAFEHGQDNTIRQNHIKTCQTGIQLWERAKQPVDWGYAQRKDVRSRDYVIGGNVFEQVAVPLSIAGTDRVAINDDNQFFAFSTLLKADQPNEGLVMAKNDVYQKEGWGAATSFVPLNRQHTTPNEEDWQKIINQRLYLDGSMVLPEPLPDAMDITIPRGYPQGRAFILLNEWGPYNFAYPSVWLREVKGDEYTLLLLGPVGNWKVVTGQGFEVINPKTGTFPATVVAIKDPAANTLSLTFEYIGEQLVDQFGIVNKRGAPVPFSFTPPEIVKPEQ